MAYPFQPMTNETIKKLSRDGPERIRPQRNRPTKHSSNPIPTKEHPRSKSADQSSSHQT